MQTINLYEAKNSFSKLVDAAQEGEVIIIARNGEPTAKLVALDYGERSNGCVALTCRAACGGQGWPEDQATPTPTVDHVWNACF